MHSTVVLPDGYREIEHINLQTDKKTALKINLTGAAVMIVMFAVAHFAIMPLTEFFSSDNSLGFTIVQMLVLFAGYFAYIVLHELTHAAVMKLAGGTRLRFGFTGLYAYAGSEVDYFNKTAYIAVALAPLFVWGVIFGVMLALVPKVWFWTVWFWQIGNIAGAVGDIYVTAKVVRMPSDILVRDTGVEMFFYSKEGSI